LPFAGGLQVIHAPGHTLGHIVLLWPHAGGVLFVGDAASHMLRLTCSPVYEDLARGQQTLLRLGSLTFQIACFAHGGPILHHADAQFRRCFSDVGAQS
jgi:glyoxylase-like metal-dependent hydrolase (beta-lactamase superfamily II)